MRSLLAAREKTLVRWVRQRRTVLMGAFDLGAWIAGFLFFAALRFSESSAVPWAQVALVGAAAGVVHLVICRALRLHEGRARTASLEEMTTLGVVTLGLGFVIFVVNLAPIWVPRSAPALAALTALALMVGVRAAWRLALQVPGNRRTDGVSQAVVVGAGDAANDLLRSMQRDPDSTWVPVALLDDDPRKRYLRLRGVAVTGTLADLAATLERTGADAVVIAIPSATTELITDIRRAVASTDRTVDVKVLPSTAQLLTDRVDIRDIRDINLTDYLGRSQLDTDVDSIAEYLTGRRILVTGAGGSIGSELCRQISRYEPAELMMLDRDESALHAVQLSLTDRALLDSDDVILCDIRDTLALHRVMLERRPEVVFHAAALKHLPMLEQYPAEAVKTNVWGTRNVLDAAQAAGVERFVNISTDKAADPCSVLGWSKRLSERLTAQRADLTGQAYLSVRFGNVLGSRGSVLTAFAKQIAVGGPVTVTDPDVTRFFMTVEEACQLVVQAAAIGRPGEALVLDMGEPIRIVDVARQMIAHSGKTTVDIEFTGLRPGEKLHEDLFGEDEEQGTRPAHPLVSHVSVPPISIAATEDLPTTGSTGHVRDAIAALSGSVERTSRVG
ncbi:nucleoside-diphosphate sugar epimerase/dehydratase [uncultured Nocardioides sp.]|uniref:polysaccharide biosynthesis protein n=1 Tax=uncultured Nocardioides sp. TaxID=198441 RepID=UPI0026162FED|nr:nucleoside-diphosphate sugar epimerase/dehydratase [uncultured Nocardioides sp.]